MNRVYIFCASLLVLVACQGNSTSRRPDGATAPSLATQRERSRELLTVNSILVPAVEIDETARRNISTHLNVNEELQKVLQQEVTLRVVHENTNAAAGTSRQDYIAKAKKQNLDGILITRINHFVTRQGSAYGSARPAQVDFIMQLVRARDGKTIWDSSYHYKDEALSDNLFHIKDRLSNKNGAGFKSAEELLTSGYHSSLSDFSQKRFAEFSAK